MRIVASASGPAQPETVFERLRSGSAWTGTGGTVTAADRGWWLRFERPVPVAVRLQLDPQDDTVGLTLVEGDLSELEGTIRVATGAEGGSAVTVRVDLAFPVVVPGTLLREIDGRLVPAWLAALVAEEPAAQ